MADVKDHVSGRGGGAGAQRMFRDNGDTTYSEAHSSYLWAWDTTDLVWKKLTVDHATGNLNVLSSGGGGGGAVTIADGADVAQGTTTDASSANTIVGIAKAIKAAVQGTLTVGGTVTANAGTNLNTSALALDATLTGGTQKAIARGGAKGTTAAADLTSNPIDVNTQALHVDGSKVTQPVSGTFWQATQPVSGTVTADTELPAASALADADANPTTSRVGSNGLLWNGATWDRAPGDKTNGAKVQSAQLPAALAASGGIKVDLAGTGANSTAVKVDGSAVTQPVSIAATVSDNVAQVGGVAISQGQKVMASSFPVVVASDQSAIQEVGNVASGASDSGNPVKTGALATFPAIPALVATGQRVNAYGDLAGAVITRKRPVAMYSAVYRKVNSTAANRALSTGALTANTNKQIATIYHLVSSAKRVQIKYIAVVLSSNSVLANVEFEIETLSATTAPATGNPAITPGPHDNADGAAEATCLALPTTPGSVLAVDSPVGYYGISGEGVTGAANTTNPPTFITPIVLWDSRADGDGKDLIMRKAVAEGYAVIARADAATTLLFNTIIIFTEE